MFAQERFDDRFVLVSQHAAGAVHHAPARFDQGREAKVVYSKSRGTGSHFVRVGLLKEVDLAVKWSGQLSSHGLEKMRKAIEGLDPEMWGQYKVNSAQRLKTSKGKR